MKPILLFLVLLTLPEFLPAQHCPWDCTGMILLQTNIPAERFYKLELVLTDENKNELYDTVYGTGKDTWDECKFLSYEDFTAYRSQRTAVHHFYEYDTFYHFAQGLYMVKYNFCDNEGKKLYLRFFDQRSGNNSYRYIEIPESMRIHLHDYSRDLWARNTEEIKKSIQPFILKPACEDLLLDKEECK